MAFKTEDDAKHHAIKVTTRHYSLEEAQHRLEEYKEFLKYAITEDDKSLWKKQIEGLENWINSDEFKTGNYPQAIDELLLELIEWRASIYAFQYAETNNNLFTKHPYHAQWLAGAIYAIFSIIGKLARTNSKKDNSLGKLWGQVSEYIGRSGLCGPDEATFITEKMHHTTGHFTNKNSKAIFFRNKQIAHNERMPRVAWDEIDFDIQLLCRSWSLITMWSSIGIPSAFRSGRLAFSGLENIFNPTEMKALIGKRDEYLSRVRKWCVVSLCNDEVVSTRSPFAEISIKTELKQIKK